MRHGHAAGGRVEQHLLHAGDAHRRVQAVDRDFHADAPHVRRELRGALAGFRERHAAIRAGEEAQRRADRIRHDLRALHDHLVGLRAHAFERRAHDVDERVARRAVAFARQDRDNHHARLGTARGRGQHAAVRRACMEHVRFFGAGDGEAARRELHALAQTVFVLIDRIDTVLRIGRRDHEPLDIEQRRDVFERRAARVGEQQAARLVVDELPQ
ncbi:Uncharacterised protein [Burkholderia pseudomallei]|nr:Uncharacterised protein [Burkholderia pseudomallei]